MSILWMQVTNLTSKVDMLSSDLKSNRVTRDSVVTDLESVNQLAVRLNTEKIDLLNRIGTQNSQVENLQSELVKLREELLSAMGQLEEERHRARTLQNMVTNTTVQEDTITNLCWYSNHPLSICRPSWPPTNG